MVSKAGSVASPPAMTSSFVTNVLKYCSSESCLKWHMKKLLQNIIIKIMIIIRLWTVVMFDVSKSGITSIPELTMFGQALARATVFLPLLTSQFFLSPVFRASHFSPSFNSDLDTRKLESSSSRCLDKLWHSNRSSFTLVFPFS